MCCAGSCAARCATPHMMGAREPLMHRLVPALVRQMGAAYPELVRAEALIVETLLLEETRFRQTLDRGLHLLTEETGAARRAPAAAWRGGVPAVRHLRLPARPDAGRAARAGARGGPRRLRGGDGGAARPRPRRLGRVRRGRHRAGLVRAQGEGRRVGVPRLFDRDGGGGDRRAGGERRAASTRPPGRGGRGGAEPDAVLWRKRRSGRRYRHDHRRRRPAHRGDRHAEEAGRSVRASRPRRGRRGTRRHGRCWRRWTMRAAPRSARITRRRICCTRRCAAAGHACHAEGQPERARPAALRHLAAAAADRRRHRLGRGRGECARAREQRGDDAADDAGRRGRDWARWRCSARNTARRCASSRWATARATRRPTRSSCAAARMSGAPATSAISRSCPRVRWPPACGASRR